MFQGKTEKEIVRIRGNDIQTTIGEIPHINLLFYPDNPRIYSFMYGDGHEPTQEEIFEKLRSLEHVKQLVQSIKLNGGLIEPIIVRKNMVLEGNSRLAAYRLLFEKDAIKWGLIKAKVFPPDTDDSLVFALLGELHLIGKKDWAPYEQAGFLYRRHCVHKIDQHQIAIESGLSKKRVTHLISVYKFMVESGQNDPDRWSYYDEYLKSRDIKRMREEFPILDKKIIAKINTGEIPRAVDLRDKLKVIAKSNHKNQQKFAMGEKKFEEAYEYSLQQGFGNNCFERIHAFRNYISDFDTEKKLSNHEKNVKEKCLYEIKKIHHRVEHLEKRLIKLIAEDK